MKNSIIYILGATVLVGGAYLFLKNKKKKDLSKLAELGGATTGGTTSSGATSGGKTSAGITPNISEPVKIEADLNLDTYNLQNTIEEYKKLEQDLKKQPQKFGINTYTGNKVFYSERDDNRNKEYWLWYDTIYTPSFAKKLVLNDKLAKLGYKFENGLLIKI